MSYLHTVAFILLLIGGLNWGLVGLFDFNLVSHLFGGTAIEKIVYILVGLAAIVEIVNVRHCCAKHV